MSDKRNEISDYSQVLVDKTQVLTNDLEVMLAEMRAGELVGGRKLTFVDQCAAFAALYSGARNQVVARAFGISLQATSKLSGCLQHDPNPNRLQAGGEKDAPRTVYMDHNRNRRTDRSLHYQSVWREFDALGCEEFVRRYYPLAHKRIMLAKVELRKEGKKTEKKSPPIDKDHD